jgi:Tol biopolymer transport system component
VDTVLTGLVEGWSPAWSPDGVELAFVGGPFSGPQVWLARRDGSAARPIEATIPGILRTVRWSR